MTEQPYLQRVEDIQQKQKVGRPAGVSKSGLTEKPPTTTRRIGDKSISTIYFKKQLSNGEIRYYKKEKVYNHVQERKRRTILNAKYKPVKRAKISNIKKALSENMDKLSIHELDTLARIFTQCDISAVKNNIIRLHKEDLAPSINTAITA